MTFPIPLILISEPFNDPPSFCKKALKCFHILDPAVESVQHIRCGGGQDQKTSRILSIINYLDIAAYIVMRYNLAYIADFDFHYWLLVKKVPQEHGCPS